MAGKESAALQVAIVHDYLTQRGGAERVVLSMLKAFPGAPVYTSLYEPRGTFPEFREADVRTSWLDTVPAFRRHHRLAFGFLAPVFSRMNVHSGVVLCSSSGWAHGVSAAGKKIVYCHAPARWLYQGDRYLRGGRLLTKALLKAVHPYLTAWDRNAASTADLYLTNSRAVAGAVQALYGIDATLVPPPWVIDPRGECDPLPGVEPGFVLCVSRLLAYKNVDKIVSAFRLLPTKRLVVVGTGPDAAQLRHRAPPNVHFAGEVTDRVLRWLYSHASGLVAASYEDFGLTPLEAAAFGKPSAVLRWGGFLDTVLEGVTGTFFEEPRPEPIAEAVSTMLSCSFDSSALCGHASQYSEESFVSKLRSVVLA